jgi:hypothetical protein
MIKTSSCLVNGLVMEEYEDLPDLLFYILWQL